MAVIYGLRDCTNALPTIYTNTLLTPGISTYVNTVVKLKEYPDSCWIVYMEGSLGSQESLTVLTSYDSCAICQEAGPVEPTIYKLNDCKKLLPPLYTNPVLTPGIENYSTVYLADYPDTCWIVQVSLTGSPVPYIVANHFEKCDECIAAIPTQPINVYILNNCVTEDVIYSFSTVLNSVIGKVVKLLGYDDNCWNVGVTTYDDQTTEDVFILNNEHHVPQIFDDCTCCLPPVDPTPVKYTRVIPKPDRAFYQITQSQCDIDANIKFAENYYRLFKKLKYGINSMCDNIDLDKVWIKKQLSDYAIINDPAACIITTPPTPVICPEPEGNPYIPPVTTYSFHVNDGGAGTNFSCGGNCLDGSSVPIQQACPAFNFTLDYDILPTIDVQKTYVFSYNGGCVLVYGGWIAAGINPGYSYTYALQSSNIIDANYDPDPCQYCPA